MAINYKIEIRLQHWAAWTIQNFSGWPEESPIYRFMREGFLGNENKNRKSSIPFKHNKKAEEVYGLFLQLEASSYDKAEAIYVYYVKHTNIREFAKKSKINHSTFYRRLRDGKKWIGERLE